MLISRDARCRIINGTLVFRFIQTSISTWKSRARGFQYRRRTCISVDSENISCPAGSTSRHAGGYCNNKRASARFLSVSLTSITSLMSDYGLFTMSFASCCGEQQSPVPDSFPNRDQFNCAPRRNNHNARVTAQNLYLSGGY